MWSMDIVHYDNWKQIIAHMQSMQSLLVREMFFLSFVYTDLSCFTYIFVLVLFITIKQNLFMNHHKLLGKGRLES